MADTKLFSAEEPAECSELSFYQIVNEIISEYVDYILQVLHKYDLSIHQKQRIEIEIARIIEKLNEKNLNMAVVGEFSAGKSTFINAFLREKLLEADVVQGTTVTSTLIKYNSRKTLAGFDEAGKKVRLLNTESAIELAELLQVFTSGNKSLFRTLEVGFPSDFLNKGICIIDTPGTNSVEQWHEEITKDTIRYKADACIILISAEKPLPQTFRRFIQENLEDVINNCIFVVTKIDLIHKKEQKRQLQYIKNVIKNQLDVENPLVLPYCALKVIDGSGQEYAEDNDNTENEIIHFLQEQRLRIQLQRCVSLLEYTIVQLTEYMQVLSREQKEKHERLMQSLTSDLDTFVTNSKKKYQQIFNEKTENILGDYKTLLHEKVQYQKQRIYDEFQSIQDSQILKRFLKDDLGYRLQIRRDELFRDADIAKSFYEMDEVAADCCVRFERDFQKEYKQLVLLAHDMDLNLCMENATIADVHQNALIAQKVTDFDKAENRTILGSAAAGAALGSIIPGIGTLIGFAVGFAAGLLIMPKADKLKKQVFNDFSNTVEQYFAQLEDDLLRVHTQTLIQSWKQVEVLMNQYLSKYTFVVREMKQRDQKARESLEKVLKTIDEDIMQLKQKSFRIHSFRMQMQGF